MLSLLADIFYPKKCLSCLKLGKYICFDCAQTIIQSDLICPYCEQISIGGKTHSFCQKSFGIDGLWSLGGYKDLLKIVIQKYKYRFIHSLAFELADLFLIYISRNKPIFLDLIKEGEWIVTSVPLHKSRQKWRGFNQSSLLACNIAKRVGLNYQELLSKTKNTKSQAGLNFRDRQTNLSQAFVLNNKNISGKNILIFDDVWTTGQTIKQCAGILKRSGAVKVWAITLAK